MLVNGSCVNIPSYLIKAGDVISIKEKVQDSQRYKDIVAVTGSRMVPEWLEANIEALSGTVKQIPTREMIDVPVDEMLIVELYPNNNYSLFSSNGFAKLCSLLLNKLILFECFS